MLMRTLALLTSTLTLVACLPREGAGDERGRSSKTESPQPESQRAETDPIAPPEAVEPIEPNDPRFHDTLLRAAASYREWGRVDERPDLAPWDCRAPTWFPSHVRRSEADDAKHGHKLYYLFAGLDGASARDPYSSLGTSEAVSEIPIGLTIVKQSWVATPSKRPPKEHEAAWGEASIDPPPPVTVVKHQGVWLEIGEQAELFVMAKLGAPDMPGTDAGWIYGTLTADGKTVTSAGLVRSCMDCHESATHERLFGLQNTKTVVRVESPWLDKRPDTLGLE